METKNGHKRQEMIQHIENAVWLITATVISFSSIMVVGLLFLIALKLLNVI